MGLRDMIEYDLLHSCGLNKIGLTKMGDEVKEKRRNECIDEMNARRMKESEG
jgi:hypothetical protein